MSGPVDLTMANAFIPGKVALSASEQALVERRARLLGPAYRLMYDRPLHIVRGEGVWLYDADGKPYLDVYNNVASLGHCHPAVVEAIARQAAVLATNTRYLHEIILDYAERLLATFPAPLGHVMFTCTGSEANDLAYRIARTATGGTGIIVTETAYHGITDTVSQFSPSLGAAVPLGAHVRTVPAPHNYGAGADVGQAFGAAVERAAADLIRHGIRPAMLIVDSLFTSDGVCAEPASFLAPAVEAIRRAGGLFVADEVQPGFGRSGRHMWGFQRHGVVPDLVTLGKPMGNGQPVAGLVAPPAIVDEFGRKARYFNTFGGNAVSCAAAMAVLRTIEQDRLMANADAVGAHMRAGIARLAESHGCIGAVRGAGLMMGVDVVADGEPDAAATARIVNGLRERGVLISSCGARHNVLKIRPPLVFSRDNADHFLDRLGDTLAARSA